MAATAFGGQYLLRWRPAEQSLLSFEGPAAVTTGQAGQWELNRRRHGWVDGTTYQQVSQTSDRLCYQTGSR